MHPYSLRRRRKERTNVDRFNALITTPAVGAFDMPANGRIRFVATAGSADGALAATLEGSTTREIRTPLLTAGGYVKLDNVERAVNVDPEAGFDVEVDTGLGVWKKIAEGA